MRTTTALISTIVIVGSAEAGAQRVTAPAEEKTATFNVTGMACNICAGTVERAAKRIAGVKAAKADQPKGIAEITFDPAKITAEGIAKLLTKESGFKTEPKKTTKK
jgi:copper chaperone CopZ